MGRPALEPTKHCFQRDGVSRRYIRDEEGGVCIDDFEVTNASFEEEMFVKQGISFFGVFVKGCAPTGETNPPVLIDHLEDPVALARRYHSVLDGRKVCGVEVKPLLATDVRGVPEELSGPEDPAVNVSWTEAQAYCAAKGGRLPLKAEYKQVYADSRYGFEWLSKNVLGQSTNYAIFLLGIKNGYGVYQEGNFTEESLIDDSTFRCAYPPLNWEKWGVYGR